MDDFLKYAISPRHLWVFNVTARTRSFTAAASHLNVSQPAVSKTIRQLEKNLGVDLFNRIHRRVELTEAGEKLNNVVAPSFDDILLVAKDLHAQGQAQPVTLSVPSAFANYWLIPRLTRFHEAFPDIDLRIKSTIRERQLEDSSISFEIRRGTGNWPGVTAEKFADEIISPILSKTLSDKIGEINNPEMLKDLTLIHLEEPVRARLTWKDWFDHFGVNSDGIGTGLRLNDYTSVLHAVMAGEGIALGWHHITEQPRSRGHFLRLEQLAWKTGQGFYLSLSTQRKQSPDEIQVYEWMLSEINAQEQEI